MEEKTNVPGMYKVAEGVIINKDNQALEAYRARKREARELVELKNDVAEIKALLKGLVK